MRYRIKFRVFIFVLVLSALMFSTETEEKSKSSSSASQYVLDAKDLITVTVFGAPELNGRVRISESGTITLPLVGAVRAAGLTGLELEKKLQKILEKDFLKSASVSVFINEYRSKRVSVLGAVASPGSFELVGTMTLLEAISRSGGITDSASGRILLRRKGEKVSRSVDAYELIEQGKPELNIPVYPGDIINVPRVRFVTVYIFGQVRNPGTHRIRVKGSATLLKAIAQAGGFTQRAKRGSVTVKRRENNKSEKFKVNVRKVLSGKTEDFILRDDDVIHVPESLF